MSAGDPNGHGMPSHLTFFMQVSFNTAGSVILMPWTFATLGYVSGPLLMALFFGVTLKAQSYLNRAAVDGRAGAARTLKELVTGMAGRRLGAAAAGLQAANLLLVMPAELDVTATALQYVVNARPGSAAHCNIIYVLVVAVPAVLVTQVVRRFGHKTGALACTSFALIVTKCALIVYGILRHADLYASDAAPVLGTGAAALSAGTYTWPNLFSALGNFLWVFAPVFLNTELVAEMQKPHHVHCQLLMACCCMFALYAVVGIVGARTWGLSVQDPINLQLPYDWVGVTVNVLLLYSAWLDYLISEIVFTGYVQEIFEPGFDKGDFSAGACARWFAYSMPANTCALVLISTVPQLETLVGVIVATSVTLSSWTIPALAGLHWGRRPLKDEETADAPAAAPSPKQQQQQQPPLRSIDPGAGGIGGAAVPEASSSPGAAGASGGRCVPDLGVRAPAEVLQWAIAALGVLAMAALVASSLYFIATAEYGDGDYFCDVVG